VLSIGDAGIAVARQVAISVFFKGAEAGDCCKADIVVAGELILEITAITTILQSMRCNSERTCA